MQLQDSVSEVTSVPQRRERRLAGADMIVVACVLMGMMTHLVAALPEMVMPAQLLHSELVLMIQLSYFRQLSQMQALLRLLPQHAAC